jgi:hypothetical protein
MGGGSLMQHGYSESGFFAPIFVSFGASAVLLFLVALLWHQLLRTWLDSRSKRTGSDDVVRGQSRCESGDGGV